MQAPATYSAPARPMSELLIPSPVSGDFRASDIEPTIVTSSPSRIHTVPRPITTIQCHRAHGSRSRRAGMSVVMRPVSTPMPGAYPCQDRRMPETRIETSRTIAAPATDIFALLCDPQGHVAIDSSGMLQDAEEIG